ncbi:dipeptidase 1-like [Eriocheir sinensis]|uniref:dipeptidase 1-like n=1 Tax=Eriocheir sinensis TaxID=95602 RepID=UPI0021C5909F|nr:dipeptidase 1-like [Eriocheir sinensis]XP_050698810.1 dipeptidase 1-like [Eriocheir sinensis]
MELVTGRGGARRGRAVVGLDVVSHTLPRSYRAPAQHPCCPLPASPPPVPPQDEVCSEPDCLGCHPDLCSEDPNLHCSAFSPYSAHQPPATPPGDWRENDGGECPSCKYAAPPPCACPDPSCRGTNRPPPPCPWDYCPPHREAPVHGHTHIAHDVHDAHDLYRGRAASDCSLPKLLSLEERLSTALGRPPDPHTHYHPCGNNSRVSLNSYAPHAAPPAYLPHNHVYPPEAFPPAGSRLSRSLEDLPKDIKDHILRCQCSCDHMGYGNFSGTSLHRLPGLSNGCSSLSTKNSSREDLSQDLTQLSDTHKGGWLGVEVPAHVWGGVCLVLVLAGVAGVGVSVPLTLRADPAADQSQRLSAAVELLKDVPLIDGHNDLPWNIRKFMHNKLHSFNFTAELKQLRPWSRSSWSHTDLPRLKEGMVGAQFWVSYVPCEAQRLNAVQLTIEQIDLIKRLIEQYPDDLRLATSADEVEAAFREGRIASLIGVEGGHAIQNSLGVLRALRDLGVRYLTLTHTCSTPWAECARADESDPEDPNSPRGLTHFGRTVVREMNRLGLLVDLSHVSQATMREALEVSRAPVIFSHSSVYAICRNPRNVPDDILQRVALNGGVVMVSFYTHFLTCSETATMSDVVDHINHVRKVAGVQHVGIGADFDGVNKLPEGLEDVSRYPHLFAELMADPTWTPEDLKKLAGQNLLRVMRDAERVREMMSQQGVAPHEWEVPSSQLPSPNNCSYEFTKRTDD